MRDYATTTPVNELPRPETSSRLVREASAFATSLQFLTRLALPHRTAASPEALARAPIYFPLVGTLIGGVFAATFSAACQIWPVWLAALVALAIEAWLTGALHEDGVADFCDAFGGGWTRESTLAILSDSRIGTYGALGLGLAVALRGGATIVLVNRLGIEQWPAWIAALAASSAIGRWIIVLVMAWVPPVQGRKSLANEVGRKLGIGGVLTATAFTLPAVVLFAMQMPMQAALAAAMLIPWILGFMWLIRRRLGGVTGDCFGFIAYTAQTLVLLASAARMPS